MTKNTAPRCGVNPTSQPDSPKYCIFGAGAIGGTIAAQLARANAAVSSSIAVRQLRPYEKTGCACSSTGKRCRLLSGPVRIRRNLGRRITSSSP
jgi:glycine/D-amino acid oxidase-like deaminating enzyme